MQCQFQSLVWLKVIITITATIVRIWITICNRARDGKVLTTFPFFQPTVIVINL